MSYQDSKGLHPWAYSFCQLLACFDASGTPSLLFWRACSPKRKWSSKGAIFDRQPEDALVPPWLLKLFKSNSRTAITPDIPAELQEAVEMDFIKVSEVKGVQYLAVGNAWRRISIDTSTEDRSTRLFELLSIFIHGYPEPHTELLCEEVTAQLSEATEASCLPVLSIVNRHDLKKILEATNSTSSVSYLVSLLQFVVRLLSIKRNSQPRSLRALIPEIMGLIEQHAAEISSNDISYARLLQALQELTSQLSSMDRKIIQPELFTAILQEMNSLQSYDERSNATIGLAFTFFSRDIRASFCRKEATKLCAKWRPISEEAPSPMEIFTAASIIPREFTDLWLPIFRTGDLELRVLTARAMAQNNFYPEACMLLEECLQHVEDRFGSESFEITVTLAELINYLNILDNAERGEQLGCRALERRQGDLFRDRTDTLYLKVAVADSLIGLSRYAKAQQLLREVMNSSFPSDSLVIKAALRLVKVQRRHGTDDDPLKTGSPLYENLSRVSFVSEKLQLEYLQELACAICITKDKDSPGSGKVWTEIYGAFRDILERMVSNPSASWAIEQISTSTSEPPERIGDIDVISIQSSFGAGKQDHDLSAQEKSKSFLLRDSFSTLQLRARALHNASKTSSLITMQSCLLITPVDVRWDGETSLYTACEFNQEAAAKLLLKRGADVNAQGGFYGNALQVASAEGHKAYVQLLLERGADVNAQGGFYGNALQAASARGHKALVQLLLERGANVNTQGGKYCNALQAASVCGHEAISQLLRGRGAVLG